MLFPDFEAAFQFHYRKSFRGEGHAGIGGEMTLLGIAINDIGFIAGQAGGIVPTALRQVNRAGNMALGVVIGGPDVHHINVAGFQ